MSKSKTPLLRWYTKRFVYWTYNERVGDWQKDSYEESTSLQVYSLEDECWYDIPNVVEDFGQLTKPSK